MDSLRAEVSEAREARSSVRGKNNMIELKKYQNHEQKNELTFRGGRGDIGWTSTVEPAKEASAELERVPDAEELSCARCRGERRPQESQPSSPSRRVTAEPAVAAGEPAELACR